MKMMKCSDIYTGINAQADPEFWNEGLTVDELEERRMRQSLEDVNDEYNYGHNVPRYTTDEF